MDAQTQTAAEHVQYGWPRASCAYKGRVWLRPNGGPRGWGQSELLPLPLAAQHPLSSSGLELWSGLHNHAGASETPQSRVGGDGSSGDPSLQLSQHFPASIPSALPLTQSPLPPCRLGY